MYCFDQEKTLVPYKAKRNKCVILLSIFYEKTRVRKNVNEECTKECTVEECKKKNQKLIEFY